jgi:hypothetical protein
MLLDQQVLVMILLSGISTGMIFMAHVSVILGSICATRYNGGTSMYTERNMVTKILLRNEQLWYSIAC